jgi:hypothetical protein
VAVRLKEAAESRGNPSWRGLELAVSGQRDGLIIRTVRLLPASACAGGLIQAVRWNGTQLGLVSDAE